MTDFGTNSFYKELPQDLRAGDPPYKGFLTNLLYERILYD